MTLIALDLAMGICSSSDHKQAAPVAQLPAWLKACRPIRGKAWLVDPAAQTVRARAANPR